VFFDRDLESDGEMAHDIDSERKEKNADADMDPKLFVRAVEVRDGRVSEVNGVTLKGAFKYNLTLLMLETNKYDYQPSP
jgi:hypothetical protein